MHSPISNFLSHCPDSAYPISTRWNHPYITITDNHPIYHKRNSLQKELTIFLILFCLPGRPSESGAWPVFSALCIQWTLDTHMFSVRQCLWRLGQGSNTILAVVSTLSLTEMELISVRFPRSEEETQPRWMRQGKDGVRGVAWSFRSHSKATWPWTCSQVPKGLRRR